MNPNRWHDDDEVNAECEYQYQERLGILCGSEPETPEQEEIARKQVVEYLDSLQQGKD